MAGSCLPSLGLKEPRVGVVQGSIGGTVERELPERNYDLQQKNVNQIKGEAGKIPVYLHSLPQLL